MYDGPFGWTLEQWRSKDVALAYFRKIKTPRQLWSALQDEVGTHGSINVFDHFMEVLKKSGSPDEYSAAIESLRPVLGMWCEELLEPSYFPPDYEILQFIWRCRCWKFPDPETLERLRPVVARNASQYLGVFEDAVKICRGSMPPMT